MEIGDRMTNEQQSAFAVKQAYERAMDALQTYRTVLDSTGNGADCAFASNDADDFENVIDEIRALSRARGDHDDGARPRAPAAQ